MLKTRIIPCLDVIKNKVVKGVNFKNIRVMGNAVEMAKYYSLSGADELCMLDINASYQNRKTFIKTVESIAKVINIPSVSYTHLRAHETKANLVCRLLLEKKK